jgi:Icc-related predicted phosphoesterase
MTDIWAISDLHGHQPDLPGGDILIIAGDCLANDTFAEIFSFWYWVERLKYSHKIVVGGNHDNCFVGGVVDWGNICYLQDTGCEIDGLKIWGSPWTPWFNGQNPNAMAFTRNDNHMEAVWDNMPEDLDILVTHGPPRDCLDATNGSHVGCEELRDAILKKRPHTAVFGHLHELGGKQDVVGDTHCYNVSCVDEHYQLVRGATRIKI